MTPTDRRVSIDRQELSCELECIADSQAERHVKLTGQCEVQEGRARDPSCDAASSTDDIRDVVLGEDIVRPLPGGIYRK